MGQLQGPVSQLPEAQVPLFKLLEGLPRRGFSVASAFLGPILGTFRFTVAQDRAERKVEREVGEVTGKQTEAESRVNAAEVNE